MEIGLAVDLDRLLVLIGGWTGVERMIYVPWILKAATSGALGPWIPRLFPNQTHSDQNLKGMVIAQYHLWVLMVTLVSLVPCPDDLGQKVELILSIAKSHLSKTSETIHQDSRFVGLQKTGIDSGHPPCINRGVEQG